MACKLGPHPETEVFGSALPLLLRKRIYLFPNLIFAAFCSWHYLHLLLKPTQDINFTVIPCQYHLPRIKVAQLQFTSIASS